MGTRTVHTRCELHRLWREFTWDRLGAHYAAQSVWTPIYLNFCFGRQTGLSVLASGLSAWDEHSSTSVHGNDFQLQLQGHKLEDHPMALGLVQATGRIYLHTTLALYFAVILALTLTTTFAHKP